MRIKRDNESLQSITPAGGIPQAKARVMPAGFFRQASMESRWPKPWPSPCWLIFKAEPVSGSLAFVLEGFAAHPALFADRSTHLETLFSQLAVALEHQEVPFARDQLMRFGELERHDIRGRLRNQRLHDFVAIMPLAARVDHARR